MERAPEVTIPREELPKGADLTDAAWPLYPTRTAFYRRDDPGKVRPGSSFEPVEDAVDGRRFIVDERGRTAGYGKDLSPAVVKNMAIFKSLMATAVYQDEMTLLAMSRLVGLPRWPCRSGTDLAVPCAWSLGSGAGTLAVELQRKMYAHRIVNVE